MDISYEELAAMGFRRAGTVYPDAAKVLRVEADWDHPQGYVVYIMVVNGEFKKAGTTGRGNSAYRARMFSTFGALRTVMLAGPPYQGDPFKQHAPATILAGQEVELWAKESTLEDFEREETELNEFYRGEWTKEGWRPDGSRRLAGGPAERPRLVAPRQAAVSGESGEIPTLDNVLRDKTFRDGSGETARRVYHTLQDRSELELHRTQKLLSLAVSKLVERGVLTEAELDDMLMDCIS